MSEWIGVTSVCPDLKRELLLFDRIAWPNADLFVVSARYRRKNEHTAAAVEWLLNNGLVFRPEVDPVALDPEIRVECQKLNEAAQDLAEQGWQLARATGSAVRQAEFLNRSSEVADPLGRQFDDLRSRRIALELRALTGANAVPIMRGWVSRDPSTATSDVIHVVLNEMPIPGEAHSFEDILAFRNEARQQGWMQELRDWLNAIAKGELSASEISDRVEVLISRYDRALQLEKMARQTTVLETVIVTTAEVAESLLRFRWSTLASRLFAVKHRHVDLMRSEQTFPGREIAYIVHARNRFQ